MQSIKTVLGKFVPGLSKSILKMDFYPVFYFLCISINLLQILGCVTYQISSFNWLFKWFDLSNYIDGKILVFLFAVPVIILALLILFIIFSFKYTQKNEQQEKILEHYIIKITATTAFVLSSVCCLPLIRCSISLISLSGDAQRIVAIINVTLFLTIIYPYSMFFLTDLSPQNNKIYACLMFPNCFTYLNIYRPIAAIMIGTNTQNYLPIPSTLILLALLISLLRFPLLTWRFNRISQMFMSTIIWTILFNFINLILRQEVTLVLYFVGIPIFVLFMDWLLSKRTISIIMQNESSTFKLKILYHMLINKKDYENELSIFILNHHRNCMTINCYCQSILNHVQNFKVLRQNNNKENNTNKSSQKVQKSNINFKYQKLQINSDQSKNNQIINQQQQHKQNILWYKLLYHIHNEETSLEILNKLSLTEKKSIFQQKKQLVLDKVQILTILDLQYQSLRQFWSFQEMQNGQSLFSLFFFVRMYTQTYRQQKLLKKKAQQNQTRILLYNYKLQMKIIKFRQIIYKTTTKIISFWGQLDNTKIKPDNKKLTKALQQLLVIRKQMIKQKRKVLKQSKQQNKGQKQDVQIIFDKQIKRAISMIMTPFEEATGFNFKQIKQPKLQIVQQTKIQPNSYFEKNLPFTSKIQPAGIAVINLKQGSSFGSIKMANKHFWQFLNCQRYQSPFINHFLPPQIREYHSKRMVSFLEQNKQSLYLKQVYLIDPQNNLIQLQLFVQILPSIQNGFQILTFMKAFKSVDSLFLLNNDAEIIAYNKNFKQKILPNINMKELRQLITHDKIRMFRDSPQKQIMTQDQIYLIKCTHYMIDQNILQPIYYCQIKPNKQLPIKTYQDIRQQIDRLKEYQGQNQNQNQTLIQVQIQKQQQLKKSNNFKNDKNLHTQQLQSFNKKIKYLSIERKNVIISCWKIITLILLIIIIMLAIHSANMIQLKVLSYLSAFEVYDNLTNFIQNIAQFAYMTRKINVLSFNNQTTQPTFGYYYHQLINNQQKLSDQIISLKLKWWGANFQVFDLAPNGKVISSLTTFQMILQKYMLSALTTYLEKANWSFDYVLSQQVIPYSDSLKSLMSILRNSYYIILPKTSTQFRQIIHKIQFQNLGRPIPYTPGISILLFVTGLIFFITIFVRIKIIKASQHKFLIFQQLDGNYVKQRLQSLKLYQTKFLVDLKIAKDSNKIIIQDNILSTKNVQSSEKKINDNNIKNQQTQIDIGEYSIRDFVQNTKTYDLQLKKTTKVKQQKKDKLNVSQLVLDRKIIIWKSIIGVLPILVISSFALGIQQYFSKQFWSCIMLKDLYHQKSQAIKLINSYSYEMGYQIDDFKSQNYSIKNQLDKLYQNLYTLFPKIELYEEDQPTYYNNEIKIITQTKFCQLLQFISTAQQVTQKCNKQDKQLYKQKYVQQVLVSYIETSRHLKIKYQNTNLTIQQQRQFNNQTLIRTLQRLKVQLNGVNNYNLKIFKKELDNRINQYRIFMVTISILIIPFTLIAIIVWVKYNLQQMQFQIDKIKMVLQLVSMKEIKSNQKLRNYLFSQKNMLNVLD